MSICQCVETLLWRRRLQEGAGPFPNSVATGPLDTRGAVVPVHVSGCFCRGGHSHVSGPRWRAGPRDRAPILCRKINRRVEHRQVFCFVLSVWAFPKRAGRQKGIRALVLGVVCKAGQRKAGENPFTEAYST